MSRRFGVKPSAYNAQSSPDEVVTRAFEDDCIRLKRDLRAAHAALSLARPLVRQLQVIAQQSPAGLSAELDLATEALAAIDGCLK